MYSCRFVVHLRILAGLLFVAGLLAVYEESSVPWLPSVLTTLGPRLQHGSFRKHKTSRHHHTKSNKEYEDSEAQIRRRRFSVRRGMLPTATCLYTLVYFKLKPYDKSFNFTRSCI